MAAIYDKILDAVVTRLKALTLTGIATTSIYKRKFAWNRDATLPAIFVTPLNVRRTPALNTSDDVDYGVQVTWVRASNQDLTSNITSHLEWREQITAAFLPSSANQPLSGSVAQVYDVRVEEGPVFDAGSFLAQYDVGAIALRCIARVRRATA